MSNLEIKHSIANSISITPVEMNEIFQIFSRPTNKYCKQEIDLNSITDKILNMSHEYQFTKNKTKRNTEYSFTSNNNKDKNNNSRNINETQKNKNCYIIVEDNFTFNKLDSNPFDFDKQIEAQLEKIKSFSPRKKEKNLCNSSSSINNFNIFIINKNYENGMSPDSGVHTPRHRKNSLTITEDSPLMNKPRNEI